MTISTPLMRRMSIRLRMQGAIALVLALLLLLGAAGLAGLRQLDRVGHEFVAATQADTTQLASVRTALGAAVAAQADAATTAQLRQVQDQLQAVQKALEDQGAKDTAERAAATRQAHLLFIGALALAVVLVVPLTLMNMASICGPLDTARRMTEAIAAGNLQQDISDAGQDETGRLLAALQAMQLSLRGIVGQVRQSAESIQVASSEVASGNADLSQRTEETASNLQQTASSLQQLTANVRQSADAAAQANQLAASAQAVAQRGGDVVSQVVSTMDEINHSSKRIADIIGTIDGIAFQTNILALNAAVEAARAGEQGRGFAVVASEVRSLAQRSAEAAREIKVLIGTSVDKVETGARLVQDAGSTMGEIVASVRRVTDVIGEITAASSEQSQGIAQVNGAVANLDQMTQQNAALVEQSAAAAESLKDQAQRLTGVIATFRLGSADRPAVPVAPAASMEAPRPPVPPAPPPAPRAAPVAVDRPAVRPAAAPPAPRPALAEAESDWESF